MSNFIIAMKFVYLPADTLSTIINVSAESCAL